MFSLVLVRDCSESLGIVTFVMGFLSNYWCWCVNAWICEETLHWMGFVHFYENLVNIVVFPRSNYGQNASIVLIRDQPQGMHIFDHMLLVSLYNILKSMQYLR